jgi:nucleoside-diphosphate-sugar epimerase
MIKDTTILLTGGAGFIGTTLARTLCRDNTIVIFDNLHRDAITSSGLLEERSVRLVKGDVRDYAALRDAARGCRMIVHMASIAGVDTVMKKPVETMETALEGTLNALRIAKELAGLERFIDFSTSEVFGRFAFRVQENHGTTLGAVGEARWTYAVSKLATEHLTYTYHRQFGLPALSIRPFNVYGPGQVGEGAIHTFITRSLKNEEIEIHNDGDQIRSWCYIDDMIHGILLCLEKKEAVGHSFNIGNPRSTITIYQLAKIIKKLAEGRGAIRHIQWNYPDVELRVPDINKARRLLGFSPSVNLEEGLQKTIEWYRRKLGGRTDTERTP